VVGPGKEMKWKVVIVGPTGTVYKDTNAVRLLYPFPTRQAAEDHADCLRTVGVKVALSEERPESEGYAGVDAILSR
jgi:hypothetical protein